MFTSSNNSRSPTTATLASIKFATYSIWEYLSCLYKVDGVAPVYTIPRSAILCSFVLFDIINAVSPGPKPRVISPAAKFFDVSLYSDHDIESHAEYSAFAGELSAGWSGYSLAFRSIKSNKVFPSTADVIKLS